VADVAPAGGDTGRSAVSSVAITVSLSFVLGIVVFIGVYLFLFLTRKRGGFLK